MRTKKPTPPTSRCVAPLSSSSPPPSTQSPPRYVIMRPFSHIQFPPGETQPCRTHEVASHTMHCGPGAGSDGQPGTVRAQGMPPTPSVLAGLIQGCLKQVYQTVLYCTVLYCTVLYCTVLYCTVLYCTVLYCTVLYCTVLYCTVLYCTVLYCTVLYCTVLYCTVLYCTVLYCTVLYCTVLYSLNTRVFKRTVLHCI